MKACLRARFCLVFSLLLLAASPGCVKSKYTVYVNPDGSGYLVVSRLFGRQAVETMELQRQTMQQMEGMEEMGGPEMAQVKEMMKADPFYNEKALQKEARKYGAGVKLAKSRRADLDGGRGSIAVYSFKDINDVYLSTDVSQMQSMMYGGGAFEMDMGEDDEGGGGRSRRGKGGVEFAFQTGAVSRLKILLPSFDAGDDDGSAATEAPEAMVGDDGAGEAAGDDEWFDPAMMYYPQFSQYAGHMERYAGGMMAQGMAVKVEVILNGRIAQSNASHTNGANRIVILDVDSSRRDSRSKKSVRNDDLMNFYDFNRLMRGISRTPGSVVETNREVVVTFK